MNRNLPSTFKLLSTGLLLSGSLLAHQAMQGQCVPTFTDGCILGDQIHSILINGDGGTSLNQPITGCAPGAYMDGTGPSSVTLTAGSSYTATISTNYYAPGIGEGDYAVIWIDLNNDGIFSSSERVGTSGSLLSLTGSPVSINIPSGTLAGTFRMRVMVGFNHNALYEPITATDLDPCNEGPNEVLYGEVHDYSVSIIESPLSVSLTDFSAQLFNQVAVLTWNTVSEANNRGFRILKSADGKSFTEIGWIATKATSGNSNEKITYTFNDPSVIGNSAFYQLVQVDHNGKETRSRVISLQGSSKNNISAAPNPTRNTVTVSSTQPISPDAVIVLSDLTGKVLQRITVRSTTTTIDLSTFHSGLYLIQYTDGDHTQTFKVNKL